MAHFPPPPGGIPPLPTANLQTAQFQFQQSMSFQPLPPNLGVQPPPISAAYGLPFSNMIPLAPQANLGLSGLNQFNNFATISSQKSQIVCPPPTPQMMAMDQSFSNNTLHRKLSNDNY